MLEGEDGGRREQRDLFAVHHRLERGAHGDLGLAVPNVAAQQPVHRRRRFHVALDVGDGRGLIRRQFPLEGAFELLLPVRVGAEDVARNSLARGVELEQLLGHVAHGFLDFGLRLFPGRAAKPIERRTRAAGIFLNEIEPLDRNEEFVLSVIAQLEKLLHDVAVTDGDLLQADKLRDAVIDVHDQIAGFQIAQVREECRGQRAFARRRGAPPLFLEDVGFGVDAERRVGQPESTREQPFGDDDGALDALVRGRREQRAELVVVQQLHGSLGTPMRAGDEKNAVAAVTSLAKCPQSNPEYGRGIPGRAVTTRAAPRCSRRALRWPAPRASRRRRESARLPPSGAAGLRGDASRRAASRS